MAELPVGGGAIGAGFSAGEAETTFGTDALVFSDIFSFNTDAAPIKMPANELLTTDGQVICRAYSTLIANNTLQSGTFFVPAGPQAYLIIHDFHRDPGVDMTSATANGNPMSISLLTNGTGGQKWKRLTYFLGANWAGGNVTVLTTFNGSPVFVHYWIWNGVYEAHKSLSGGHSVGTANTEIITNTLKQEDHHVLDVFYKENNNGGHGAGPNNSTQVSVVSGATSIGQAQIDIAKAGNNQLRWSPLNGSRANISWIGWYCGFVFNNFLTTDAIIATPEINIATDAIVKATYEFAITSNAIVKETPSEIIGADGIIKVLGSAGDPTNDRSITTDAVVVIFTTVNLPFTTDAELRLQPIFTANTDGLVHVNDIDFGGPGFLTTDGRVKTTPSEIFGIDGIVVDINPTPINVIQVTGAGTLTAVTNLTMSPDDIANSTKGLPIPISGIRHSFWKTIYLNAPGPLITTINNVRLFGDGTFDGSGVDVVGQRSPTYVQATGISGSEGDVLNMTNHSGIVGGPVGSDIWTAGMPLNTVGSITGPTTGRISDYVVLQALVDNTAGPVSPPLEGWTFRYDES